MKQQSKPTPGPWKYRAEINRRFDPMTGEPSESASHFIDGAEGAFVGVVSASGPIEANARMIAAAPEMLEVLKFAHKMLHETARDPESRAYELKAKIDAALEQAIAKAEGVQ